MDIFYIRIRECILLSSVVQHSNKVEIRNKDEHCFFEQIKFLRMKKNFRKKVWRSEIKTNDD